jgi:hypothetical protein
MGEWWRRILLYLELDKQQVEEQDEEMLFLKQAWLEWHDAHHYYQSICDPDLVEYAIFAIMAAETKYCYLLKQARCHGLYVHPISGRCGYCQDKKQLLGQ